MSKKSTKKQAYLKEREEGFDLDFGVRAKLPEYNALRDVNMRHYFENEAVQKHLLETGQIDQFGRLIHLEKHRSRLHIIENEFKRAEQLQQRMDKEVANARYLVRQDRLRDIENCRRVENIARRKEQERLQLEMVRVEREVLGHAHLYYGNERRCSQQKSLLEDHSLTHNEARFFSKNRSSGESGDLTNSKPSFSSTTLREHD